MDNTSISSTAELGESPEQIVYARQLERPPPPTPEAVGAGDQVKGNDEELQDVESRQLQLDSSSESRSQARPTLGEYSERPAPSSPRPVPFITSHPASPPPSSFGGSSLSQPIIHTIAVSDSPDFTLTVHQTKLLYPGDSFTLTLRIANFSSSSPSIVHLFFSGNVIAQSTSEDGQDTSNQHTLFQWTSKISLPSQAEDGILTLPVIVPIPRRGECEACSAPWENLPPSLRVLDRHKGLIATVSYELVAVWGITRAVAEVKIGQAKQGNEAALQPDRWTKLGGDMDMRGHWTGWELDRVEMAYQLSSKSSTRADLLFELKADLHLASSSPSTDVDPPSPLLPLLSRLSAASSHLLLYEIVQSESGPARYISRVWSSTVNQHDLDLGVETYEERSRQGVKLRRGFRLRDVPIASLASFSTCAWRVEYRFEIILGQLDRTALDHFQFSVPFLSDPYTDAPPTNEVSKANEVQRNKSRWGKRAWRWIARRGTAVWSWCSCAMSG